LSPARYARASLAVACLGSLVACLPSRPANSPRLTPAEYQAALDACLASATTLAEYYTCADAVDRRAFGP
jgi:hypothetical protein